MPISPHAYWAGPGTIRFREIIFSRLRMFFFRRVMLAQTDPTDHAYGDGSPVIAS